MALTSSWNLGDLFRSYRGRCKILCFQPAILAAFILVIFVFDGEIYRQYAYRRNFLGQAQTVTHGDTIYNNNNTNTNNATRRRTTITTTPTPLHPKAPHEFKNISHSTRHNLLHAHPLSPSDFADIADKLATSHRPPRMLLPSKITAGWRKWARQKRDAGVPADSWDAIAGDVAIAVKSGSEVAEDRLKALREFGWLSVGRRVPNLLVVADAPFPNLGVVDVKRYAADVLVGALRTEHNHSIPKKWFNEEGWDGDKDKNLPTLHLLKSRFPNAKWYILIDDDTYLFLDNFAKYANLFPSNKNKNNSSREEAIYAGRAFRYVMCGDYDLRGEFLPGREKDEYGVFGHGGSGIFINDVAMDRMFPKISECIRLYSDCYAGDMQVGFCMEHVGVKLQYMKRSHDQDIFTMFSFSRAMADSRYTELMNSSVKPVTFHKISANETRLIANFDRINAQSRTEFKYKQLRLYLQANGIEPAFENKPTPYDTKIFVTKKKIR